MYDWIFRTFCFPQAHQSRIATLYLPFVSVILEMKDRLSQTGSSQATPTSALANGEAGDSGTLTRTGKCDGVGDVGKEY